MKIRRSVVNKLLLRKFKMSENVTASTATRANTVLFLISTIEKNQLIPWFSFLFVLWIWERFIRTRYSNRAWEEILARAGNPADVLALMGNQLEPHPSNAGDRRIFTSYFPFRDRCVICKDLSIPSLRCWGQTDLFNLHPFSHRAIYQDE